MKKLKIAKENKKKLKNQSPTNHCIFLIMLGICIPKICYRRNTFVLKRQFQSTKENSKSAFFEAFLPLFTQKTQKSENLSGEKKS